MFADWQTVGKWLTLGPSALLFPGLLYFLARKLISLEKKFWCHTHLHNFVHNSPMWGVVVGGGVMVGLCATLLHQPKLVTWVSCGQNYVIVCSTRITQFRIGKTFIDLVGDKGRTTLTFFKKNKKIKMHVGMDAIATKLSTK